MDHQTTTKKEKERKGNKEQRKPGQHRRSNTGFLPLETVQMLKGGVQNYLSKLLNIRILKTDNMNTGMSTSLISGLMSH